MVPYLAARGGARQPGGWVLRMGEGQAARAKRACSSMLLWRGGSLTQGPQRVARSRARQLAGGAHTPMEIQKAPKVPNAVAPSELRRNTSSTATISMVSPPKNMPSGKAMNCGAGWVGAGRVVRGQGSRGQRGHKEACHAPMRRSDPPPRTRERRWSATERRLPAWTPRSGRPGRSCSCRGGEGAGPEP